MKHIPTLLALTGATFAVLTPASAETHKRASAPVVITPAAVQNGSNWSRAPFPAARPQNDVLPANGEAFDQSLPPNTPSTTPEPLAPPAPVVAIMQPRTEPGLMPTGRPGIAASAALDDAHLQPMIRNSSFDSRDQVVDNVRAHVNQAQDTISAFRHSEGQMSASGRSQFDALKGEVKAAHKQLEHSIRNAADASSSGWDAARAQLATDYDAYAAAVARMDAAVGLQPAR